MSAFQAEFIPASCAIGFLEMPVTRVVDAAIQWRKQHRGDVNKWSVSGTIAENLQRMEPLDGRKELFLSTQSPWTAYFGNGPKGAEPRLAVSYLAQVLKCQGVAASCFPQTMTKARERASGTGSYGAVMFEMFGAEATDFLNYVRSIHAANDGGRWVFSATGTPQPFELQEHYRARRVADRSTPDLLQRYCAALGINLYDPAFYGPDGVMLESRELVKSDFAGITYRQAQIQLGLQG